MRDFETVAFDEIREDFLAATPAFGEEEPDFDRCIWNGQRMVTEEEYEAELLEMAV